MTEPRTRWETPTYEDYLHIQRHPTYRGPCGLDHHGCPLCDSKDVTITAGASTLLGGSPDPNHHWAGGVCHSCGGTFSRQHVVSEDAAWYVNDDGFLLMGKVGCYCQMKKLPCECGGWLHAVLMNGHTGEPKGRPKKVIDDGSGIPELNIQFRMYSTAEPWASDWDRWECGKCGVRHDMKPFDTGEPAPPLFRKLKTKFSVEEPEELSSFRGEMTLDGGFVVADYVPRQIPPEVEETRTPYAKDLVRPEYYGEAVVGEETSCDCGKECDCRGEEQ